MVDGIICISGIEEIPTNILTRDIPIVCIDRKPKDHSNAYYVESNHYSGGYLATEELIKQGCQKIKDLQILLDVNQANYEGSRVAINQLIKNKIKFDGIFATNDWRAYGSLIALLENNIEVPKQVKVIGFDDIFISQSSHLSISTIKQDIPTLAKTASQLLFDLMNDVAINDEQKRYIIPVEVIRRDSTKK